MLQDMSDASPYNTVPNFDSDIMIIPSLLSLGYGTSAGSPPPYHSKTKNCTDNSRICTQACQCVFLQ